MFSLAVSAGAGSAHSMLFPANTYQAQCNARMPEASHGITIPWAVATGLETGLGALDDAAGSGFERPLVRTAGAVTVALDGCAAAFVDAAGFGFAAAFYKCGMRPKQRNSIKLG